MRDTYEMTTEANISAVFEKFRQHAAALDAQAATPDLNQAIIQLAQWMTLEGGWLSKSDKTTLANIGGLMFREQVVARRAAFNQKTTQIDGLNVQFELE